MTETSKLAGTFTFPGTSMTVHRMGYGAMLLAGPGKIAPVVCVQNFYNVAERDDDAFLDNLASQGIARVPHSFLRLE